MIYLMRHLHATDARFLEAFHDHGVARAAPVNTVGVLSRADEIGGGRLDAMASARPVARRYRAEPALRGLCQNVVAVAGLLAQTARTLRQAEFAALRALARIAARRPGAPLLFTADRFPPTMAGCAAGCDTGGRRALLLRFGLFGVRLARAADPAGHRQPGRAGRRAGRAAAG